MSLLKSFKKKKVGEEKREEKEKMTEKAEEVKISEKEKPKASLRANFAHILLKPYITEKTKKLAEKGQYVFEVWSKANKLLVKKAVETFYNVNVEKVRIINLPAKAKRWGFSYGKTKNRKKAIVSLAAGQKLEIFTQ